MQYEFKKNEAYINGNAFAERSFFLSSSNIRKQLLTADTFYIRFKSNVSSSTSQDFQNIEFIEAKNNVTFTDQDLMIKADYCIYYAETDSNKSQLAGRVTCTQQVTLKKGEHTLKGDKAEANLQNGTYKMYSSDPAKKVQAVLSPQAKLKNK